MEGSHTKERHITKSPRVKKFLKRKIRQRIWVEGMKVQIEKHVQNLKYRARSTEIGGMIEIRQNGRNWIAKALKEM